MYLVKPMPTQQMTAEPSGSPTSEKQMTRPVCGCRIFCDSLGEYRYASTASSIESAESSRSRLVPKASASLRCSLEALVPSAPVALVPELLLSRELLRFGWPSAAADWPSERRRSCVAWVDLRRFCDTEGNGALASDSSCFAACPLKAR
jgi:hypothetical protein